MSETAVRENLTRIQDLSVKLEETESLNRRLLTEMAALQSDKRSIQDLADQTKGEVETMRHRVSEAEARTESSLAAVRWHFMSE